MDRTPRPSHMVKSPPEANMKMSHSLASTSWSLDGDLESEDITGNSVVESDSIEEGTWIRRSPHGKLIQATSSWLLFSLVH